MKPSASRYPQPGNTGGTLIRKVIALLKAQGVELPLRGRVALAVSGGVDSMVLSHLLSRYGRKVFPRPEEQITLLHLDHGWRPESSDFEKNLVQEHAQLLGVGFESIALKAPQEELLRQNLEHDARTKRLEVFESMTRGKAGYRWVLTAHHQDDVIETLVWRFFRGELRHHPEGVKFKHRKMLRPLLEVSKEEIYQYAQEEKVPFVEDPTNRDPKWMRAFLRTELLPKVAEHFPGYRKAILSQRLGAKTGRAKIKNHQENR